MQVSRIEQKIEDIYALPEGKRAELIDGQIYDMAPPSRRHQDIAGELFGIIQIEDLTFLW